MPLGHRILLCNMGIYAICDYLMVESENICKNPWKIYGGGKFVNKLMIKVWWLYLHKLYK